MESSISRKSIKEGKSRKSGSVEGKMKSLINCSSLVKSFCLDKQQSTLSKDSPSQSKKNKETIETILTKPPIYRTSKQVQRVAKSLSFIKYFTNIIRTKGEYFRTKDFPTLCKNIKFDYFLKGDNIFLQGDQSNCMYVIMNGQIAALLNKSEGQINRDIHQTQHQIDLNDDDLNVVYYKYLIRQRNHQFQEKQQELFQVFQNSQKEKKITEKLNQDYERNFKVIDQNVTNYNQNRKQYFNQYSFKTDRSQNYKTIFEKQFNQYDIKLNKQPQKQQKKIEVAAPPIILKKQKTKGLPKIKVIRKQSSIFQKSQVVKEISKVQKNIKRMKQQLICILFILRIKRYISSMEKKHFHIKVLPNFKLGHLKDKEEFFSCADSQEENPNKIMVFNKNLMGLYGNGECFGDLQIEDGYFNREYLALALQNTTLLTIRKEDFIQFLQMKESINTSKSNNFFQSKTIFGQYPELIKEVNQRFLKENQEGKQIIYSQKEQLSDFHMYIIKKGEVQLKIEIDQDHNPTDNIGGLLNQRKKQAEVQLAILGEGQFFGYEDIIDQNEFRSYSATSYTNKVTLMKIEARSFLRFLQENQAIQKYYKKMKLLQLNQYEQQIKTFLDQKKNLNKFNRCKETKDKNKNKQDQIMNSVNNMSKNNSTARMNHSMSQTLQQFSQSSKLSVENDLNKWRERVSQQSQQEVNIEQMRQQKQISLHKSMIRFKKKQLEEKNKQNINQMGNETMCQEVKDTIDKLFSHKFFDQKNQSSMIKEINLQNKKQSQLQYFIQMNQGNNTNDTICFWKSYENNMSVSLRKNPEFSLSHFYNNQKNIRIQYETNEQVEPKTQHQNIMSQTNCFPNKLIPLQNNQNKKKASTCTNQMYSNMTETEREIQKMRLIKIKQVQQTELIRNLPKNSNFISQKFIKQFRYDCQKNLELDK